MKKCFPAPYDEIFTFVKINSFPGGRCDDGETAHETSIREMHEEIGLSPSQIWGNLSRPVVSLKMENVYACLGYIGHFEDLQIKPCPDEVIWFLNK